MRIFRFDQEGETELKEYESANVFISPFLQTDRGIALHCLSFELRGKIGPHQIMSSHLFLITRGKGWVRSDTPDPIEVESGNGVFWETGEWLEVGSGTGMTAIVVESRIPDPYVFSVRQ